MPQKIEDLWNIYGWGKLKVNAWYQYVFKKMIDYFRKISPLISSIKSKGK